MKIRDNTIQMVRILTNIVGIDIHKKDSLKFLIQKLSESKSFNLDLLRLLPRIDSIELVDFLQTSKSQNSQDFFALLVNNFKSNGLFIEIGATNGVAMSNTYLLEKKFNWTGLLVEPAKIWHKDLFTNRNCNISTKCVFDKSGDKVIFNETKKRGFSTIDSFSKSDSWGPSRMPKKKYAVETITLNDLIEQFKLPDVIDFLSIDTEGSELNILSQVDFSKYRFRAITCEHNFGRNRETIYSLLVKNGYKRVHEHLSLSDDWYVYVGQI